MVSMDMDELDIDGLINDIGDDAFAELDNADVNETYIPSKDSSDDEDAKNYNKRNEKQTDNLLDNGDTHKPNMTPINSDDEEEKGDKFDRYNTEIMEERDGINLHDASTQDLLDVTVAKALLPDIFEEQDATLRREQLKKICPNVEAWSNSAIDREVLNVSAAMSKIELTSMYDQEWHKAVNDKDDEKQKEKFKLVQVDDLSSMSCVPASFFDETKEDHTVQVLDDPTMSHTDYLRTSTVEFAGKEKKKTNFIPGKIGGDKSIVVCSACGVRLKFKKKKAKKFNYVGFRCKYTRKEYIFHDWVCVKLRKIKEAIKDYVFKKEKDEVINISKKGNFEDENALINIDTNSSQKENPRMRPTKKTTPKQGNHIYINETDEKEHEHSMESDGSEPDFEWSFHSNDHSMNDEDERDRYRDKNENGRVQSVSHDGNMSRSQQSAQKHKHHLQKLGFITGGDVQIPKHLHFRRYRTHIKRILGRMDADNTGRGQSYAERFDDLPPILLYCDLNEFGQTLFEFIAESMKSKMRKSLWHILEWLALEMPTNEILDKLKRHTHLLSKHELSYYDKVCKATMEGSKFPLACTLRLSAFMYERADVDLSNRDAFRQKGTQYVNVARKLLKEIESDHLFALLLMIPTDIGHQNVIEIALKYDLTYFLEEPRIVRVFSVIWFNGYDFLDPNNTFIEPDISIDTIFDKLWLEPGRFFFSPFGKFVIGAILYVAYLALFSYVTWLRIYDYPEDLNPLEIILWVASTGYVIYEVLEFIDSPSDYFSSMANYWDILIATNWIFLFYLRFVHPKQYIYGVDGQLDEQAQRNQASTEIYMGAWSAQCIILWTRVASLFKISERAGPLIRMIMNMLGDIANFFLIWALFFIGGTFAAYYIIGNDLVDQPGVELGPLSSVMFYIFKTLIGQQSWDKTAAVVIEVNLEPDNELQIFSKFRSNLLQTILVGYSIFGNILLLNLLIAMMASSYESVQDRSVQELNKQKIDTIYDLDQGRAMITPPFNVLAYSMYAYWYSFEIIAWALTFGHRQFNEQYFSPINHALTQYTVGDVISFRKSDRQLKGRCIQKTPKAQRELTSKSINRATITDQAALSDADDSFDLIVEHNGKQSKVKDDAILSISKSFFKRRTQRVPSFAVENDYCRYCRFPLNGDEMTIDYYLKMFERNGQHIDPDDKAYIKSLLASTDENGVPQPLTCNLCPNCYRPYKVLPKGPDVLNRMMFILEIVSYGVFWISLRWFIMIVLLVPALVIKFVNWVIRKFFNGLLSGNSSERATKSIMNTSEENDDYRSKVRQVSKSEEKLDAVVRRIDKSVKHLEHTLLADFIEDDEDEMEEDLHPLRSDEFDQQIKKMKKELDQKFSKIETLLSNAMQYN